MALEQLQTIWFILVFVLLTGYAILDGFDLGVGVLHLFARGDRERRIHLNAIGPVWDGNEVWLLTGGGALFAAFPIVYATVFSGFYLALMLLLAALILRAVSMEFRSKVESPTWRRFWDWGFGLGSLLPAILFGVAFGNILRGVPITADQEWAGSFLGLLNPYAILIGVLSLVLFTMHGAIYLTTKSEGEMQQRVAKSVKPLWWTFFILYGAATVATAWVAPMLMIGLTRNPLFWVLLALLMGSGIAIPKFACGCVKRYGYAFIASSAVIAAMMGLAALSLFPNLVPSSLGAAYSLSIRNASSSPRTLGVMLVIALIGMPLVIAYTAIIYRVFKGKVVLGEDSY